MFVEVLVLIILMSWTKVLTGREMLTLFARIRGLRSSENRINEELEKLASFVDLSQYLDRPCGQYSGGNKRKLNVALALIGRYCIRGIR